MSDDVAPPTETQTAEEATGSLLDAISQHALDATGGDVYRAGQPLAGDGDHPAAPAKAPASAGADGEGSSPSQSKPEELTRLEKLLGGKYESIEEAEKGIHQLLQDRKAAQETASTAQAELERIRGAVVANGHAPEPPPDPMSELEMLGFPKEIIERAIEHKLRAVIAADAKPYQERVAADKEIIAKYPDYEKRFEDLNGWLSQHKDIEAQVLLAENAGHYTLAREFAWLQFDRDQSVKAQNEATEAAAETTVKRTERRSDARTFQPSQTTDTRTPPVENRNIIGKDEFQKLTDLARAGYEQPLWRRTIGETLPKEVFPDSI